MDGGANNGYLLPDGLTTAKPWLSRADNAWQLTAAALVGMQSVPGLIILYGSIVKKKWAVNSAFMALYAYAATLVCWLLWAFSMSLGLQGQDPKTVLFIGIPRPTVDAGTQLLTQSPFANSFPQATYVFFQFAFAALTVVLLAGSLLGRTNFFAWMLFVPLWLTLSYTVGAFSVWDPNGFLERHGVIDFAGGYVVHLSSGVSGFVAAYWVGPRITRDRICFPPNNIVQMLGGAGFLWLGWTGFNGGSPCAAGNLAAIAVLNTHICTATSLLTWMSLDMAVYRKSSVIGAVQGMITGLVCITPAAGFVQPWAALFMGAAAGSLPWYTMMVLHKRYAFFQAVDDTLGVFHTHAVAGALGGFLVGVFADTSLLRLYYPDDQMRGREGAVYCLLDGGGEGLKRGLRQIGVQLAGAVFVASWNAAATALICYGISRFIRLRMNDDDIKQGDNAAHGEEAYAIWGDGQKPSYFRWDKRKHSRF